MIGLVAEISVEEFFAFRFAKAFSGRFQGHEDGINFAEDFGVVILENPTLLRFVVGIKNSEAFRRLAWPFLFSPYTIVVACILHSVVIVEIVGVNHERLALCKKDSAERRARFAFGVSIKDVRDMEVACGHKVADVTVRGEHLALTVQRARLLSKLIGKLVNPGLIGDDRSLISRFSFFQFNNWNAVTVGPAKEFRIYVE